MTGMPETSRDQHWESILRLPLEPFHSPELRVEAKRLINACCSSMAKADIAWLKEQVEEGKLFVTEELAVNPDDLEWQRIDAVLAGALAGFRALDLRQ
jgi:hypothetical protein